MNRDYKTINKNMYHAETPDDEYAALAAYDAVTTTYGLDCYPSPRKRRKPKRSATAAQLGGFSISRDGGPSCPE